MMRFIEKAIAYGGSAVWAAVALVAISASAAAQKPVGILKIPHGDSPASMSIHEELPVDRACAGCSATPGSSRKVRS